MFNRLDVGGWFTLVCRSRAGTQKWRAGFANGVTTQGCDTVLETAFRSNPQTLYYAGIITQSGFTGVATSDTHASHPGWNEWTVYVGDRPQWITAPSTGGIMPTRGTFTWVMGAGGSLRGAFLASLAAKGSTSPIGRIYCTATMPNPLPVADFDVIQGTYILTIRE